MTILDGDYPDVKVETLDLVGYVGGGKFVIINPIRRSPIQRSGRKLPEPDPEWKHMPWCIRARIENNQVVNFNGNPATLHDVNGEWIVKKHCTLEPLAPFTFFEIGNTK